MPSFLPFLQFLCLSLLFSTLNAYPFTDVTFSAGIIPQTSTLKYGGASLADLNADGHVDLVLGFHGGARLQLYYNNGNGTFSRSRFSVRADIHAVNPVRLTPYDTYLHFIMSRGGSYGRRPNPPTVYRTTSNIHRVIDDTRISNFQNTKGRGRSTIFFNMKMNTSKSIRPDVLVLNASPLDEDAAHHFAFSVKGDRTFSEKRLRGPFRKDSHSYGTITDVDNDGRMEFISLHELSIWKLTDDYKLSDITTDVLPRGERFHAVAAIAELDYDNDGDWDLVLVRSATNDLRWTKNKFPRVDFLLRNDGGAYTDVSVDAGIPRPSGGNSRRHATQSRGVTVGDFDNDGWVDIFIVRYDHDPAYILLRNNGRGGFERMEHGFDRDTNVPGDMATAVDYDGDGRLDLVLSEGHWFDKSEGGKYRLMRNIMNNGNGFLLVRVKNARDRSTTSLHAIVKIETLDGRISMRRVGTPGTAVSLSFIETVHFGLGTKRWVRRVTVTWRNGYTESRPWVRANSTIEFGV